MGEGLYKRVLCLKIFNDFFMYLFRWRKGGGVALMHVLENIVCLSYRTARWMFMKLGRDEVLMVPHLCSGFSANSAKGWIQGGAKLGQWGIPSPKVFFFKLEGYSDKLMHDSDLKVYGKKRCYFWFHSEVKFLTRFYVFLDLVNLVDFNAISVDLYAVRCFICIFCVISMFISGRMLI